MSYRFCRAGCGCRDVALTHIGVSTLDLVVSAAIAWWILVVLGMPKRMVGAESAAIGEGAQHGARFGFLDLRAQAVGGYGKGRSSGGEGAHFER